MYGERVLGSSVSQLLIVASVVSGDRQLDVHARSLAPFAFQLYAAAGAFDDAAHDVQADPLPSVYTFVGVWSRVRIFKDAPYRLRNAVSSVVHFPI